MHTATITFLSDCRPGANPTTSEFATTTPALRCSGLQRFFKIGESILINATQSAANFYNAGVVTNDRRVGSSDVKR
jgi:hypothetical protein